MLVNKPVGLFTQAAPGVPSLERQLAEQLRVRDNHPGNPFIGLPHRLDRATSGILMIARNKRALKKFGEQFQSRKIGKFYLAVVEGELVANDALWEDSLRKVPDEPRGEIVSPDSEGARTASMRIQSLLAIDGLTLCLVQLLTGRMHQIRIQAAHRGFPILGDSLYGAKAEFGLSKSQEVIEATNPDGRVIQDHALHALRIEFRHPQNAKLMSGTAGPSAAWETLPLGIQSAVTELIGRSRSEGQSVWTVSSALL